MRFELKPKDCHFRSTVNPEYCEPHQLADYGTICAEKAYRRGVGQTLAMLEHYAEQLKIDKNTIARLQVASHQMRYDCMPHSFYLDELVEPLIRDQTNSKQTI